MAEASDKLIDKIAENNKLDKRVVRHIVYHPFLFTSRIIRSKEDYTPIMFRYLGKFVARFGVVKRSNEDSKTEDNTEINSNIV
jgi:nucleoid DNA-binding protein